MTRDQYPYPLPYQPEFRFGPCRVRTCAAPTADHVEVDGLCWPVCEAHAWHLGKYYGVTRPLAGDK